MAKPTAALRPLHQQQQQVPPPTTTTEPAVPYFFDDSDASLLYRDPQQIWTQQPGPQTDSYYDTLPTATCQDIVARLERLEAKLAILIDAPDDVKKRVRAALHTRRRRPAAGDGTSSTSEAPKIACTNCRRHHEACSHDTPCKRCSDKGLTCTYRARLPWASREQEEGKERVQRDGVSKKRKKEKKRKAKLLSKRKKLSVATESDGDD
jgi:hypothetical protein